MKPNNMWMNFLLRGSVFITCLFLAGCSEQTDWVHRGEWYYVNESSHVLFLEGAITKFTVNNPEIKSFRLDVGESHCLEFRGGGSEKIEPEYIPCPYIDNWGIECRITIDDAVPVSIPLGVSVRNRANYRVEKVNDRFYRFTYVFTDENLKQIVK